MMIERVMKTEMQQRWDRMQKEMKEMDADGCLLSLDSSLYYVTGSVYNGYFYLPVEGSPWFFVKRPVGYEGDRIAYIGKPEHMLDIFKEKGVSLPKALLMEADELPYSEYMRISKMFNLETELNATSFIRRQRMIKTDWEVNEFRTSAAKHADTYAAIPTLYKPGMTDTDLQIEIEYTMRKNGCIGLYRTFGVNMHIFMGSVLAGENAEMPSPYDFTLGGAGTHPSFPISTNNSVLKEGTSVMVDMNGNFTAYMTDMTRVYSIGKLSELAYKAHQVALEIQEQMEQIARPGASCAELYTMAIDKAEKEGLASYFMGLKQQAKFLGHGIGIQINELPVLTPRSRDILQKNMVYAYEPKFVIPGVGAVGIENSYLVTDSGVEKLTKFEEGIIELK